MPNWNIRVNALPLGRPVTRVCRMPMEGRACITRTSRSIAGAVMRLSASRTMAKSCPAPQRSQKSRMLPALKPSPPSRRRWRRAMSPPKRACRWTIMRASAAATSGSSLSLST